VLIINVPIGSVYGFDPYQYGGVIFEVGCSFVGLLIIDVSMFEL
jgi:hypothetical protein